MILEKPYTSLDETLLYLKKQVKDSLKYAAQVCPHFYNPEPLFYWLKDRLTYEHDPDNTELLMTMQTLLTGIRTGTPGAGDCDDFTITALACLIVNGFENNNIILAGRERGNPVHIYVETVFKGKSFIFDLTEEDYNVEREYKYYQSLKFNL